MAASCEHGSARIKVQVVATLLPLNVSVHVDPFWSLIRFSESPTIRDVENKIITCLNCMGEEYPAELVVHDSPITPAWTYLPSSSPICSGSHLHQVTLSKSNISDASVSEQQLTIVLRPLSRRTGPWIHKPPKPVLMSYEISDHLSKSARLTFKTQLVFMHDCVLLSGSKSDILMDNDVVTIHAICYFCFMKDDGASENQSCKQVRMTPEDEFESYGSLGDLDEDSLFCDTETQIRTNTEAKLPSEIRTKIDKLLKKLKSLQHANLNEKSSTDWKKSKKRKAEKEGSRSELSKRFLAISDRNDVHVEERRKTEERDIRSELSNRVLVSGRNDVQVEEKRKAEEEDSRSQLSKRFLVVSGRNDVQVEVKGKAEERDIRSELSNRVLAASDKTDAPSEDKRKADQGDNDSLLRSSIIATLGINSIESEKQQITSVDHLGTQDQNSINDETSADNLLSKSKKKKKKHKKKMKYDVGYDSLMDTSVTQITDATKQNSQACVYVNDKPDDLVQIDSAANMAVPPLPSTARGKRRKPRNTSEYGVSSLLCILRKQQSHEINCRDGKDKSQINTQKVDKQRNENPVSEKTDVSFHDASDQLNSSIVSPKRKRIRKKKQKNVNLDKHTSHEQIPKIIVRDYTLKLPEHQMPKNSRVTFECESDSDDDDATSAGQTVEEDMQSVSCVNLVEHPANENSVTESTKQLCSQPEEEHKSAHQKMAGSDITKTSSLNDAGAPINPDEKFQALLNQCGRTGRQFETINSANGHTVIRSSRKKHITHAGLSTPDATGDLEEDVLTNVSIVLQKSSEAKTPTSNSSSHVQCFPTEVVGNMSSLSHLSNGKLNTRSLITPTPDLKPVQTLVEVTPLYMNYSSCTELCGLPREADIIAYKILEMAEDYTPGLSSFKEAKVIQVDAQTGYLLLEPRGGKDNKKRLGRFELNFNDNKETGSTGEEELVAANLSDLVDVRLVFRADGSQ